MMALQSANLLLSIAGGFVGAILSCAVLRAVLKPEDGRFAYLRLAQPRRFLPADVWRRDPFIVAILIIVIPLTMVVVIAVVVHAAGAAVLVALAGCMSLLALLIYVLLRLSMAGPMIVEDTFNRPDDTWSLTRGRVSELLPIGISPFVILIFVMEVFPAPSPWRSVWRFLSQAAGSLAAVHGLFARPSAEILAILGAWTGSSWAALVAVPVFGCPWAILAAPWARRIATFVGLARRGGDLKYPRDPCRQRRCRGGPLAPVAWRGALGGVVADRRGHAGGGVGGDRGRARDRSGALGGCSQPLARAWWRAAPWRLAPQHGHLGPGGLQVGAVEGRLAAVSVSDWRLAGDLDRVAVRGPALPCLRRRFGWARFRSGKRRDVGQGC